jgi:hypothetical protein
MQRRAAAAYFAFFLVVSVAAYAYIGVAESQRPQVQLEGEGGELTNESTFTVGGQTYTVSNIHQSGGGGHGGGGAMVADLSWTNNSSSYTATIEDGSTTTLDNTTYNVSTSSGTMTLTEQLNVTALLRADDAVENTTATQDGTEYVVYRANDSLEPLSEWLPEPETVTYSTGDSFTYAADSGPQETTITNITNSSATLSWVAPRDNTVELAEGGNLTLSGQQYFAHFPDHSSVVVASSDQYGQYQETRNAQDYFHERKNGLWGVSILSGIASVLMLGMAYLPQRG